jgi:hypothetical protein
MSGKYGDDSRGSTLVFPATSAKALVGIDGAPVEVAVVVLVVLKVLLKKRHHNYISHIVFNRHKKGSSNSFELGVFFGKIINLILFPIFSIKSPRVQLSCA